MRLSRAPAALSSWFRPLAILIAVWGFSGILVPAFGQGGVPLPVDEQVRMFQSLPPAQQQALIRELQEQLPPAQRQAIVRILQEGGRPEESAGLEGAEGEEDEQAERRERVRFRAANRARGTAFAPAARSSLARRAEDPLALDAEAEAQRRSVARTALQTGIRINSTVMVICSCPGVAPIALAGLNVEQATVR